MPYLNDKAAEAAEKHLGLLRSPVAREDKQKVTSMSKVAEALTKLAKLSGLVV